MGGWSLGGALLAAEDGRALLEERGDPLPGIGRAEQPRLALLLHGERGFEVEHRGVDRRLGGRGRRGEEATSCASSSSDRSANRWSATHSETSPHSAASGAGTFSPVRASRIARARPTLAATSAVAPPSGISPIRAKASTNDADAVAST